MNENINFHGAAELFGFIMAVLIFLSLSNICHASEMNPVLDLDSEVVQQEIVVEFPETINTMAVNEDDYNSGVSTLAVNGDVYSGSYNSTVLSIWNGLLSNNVGKDYVAWRSSQYEYHIFFGEDFEYSSGQFSGTGKYYSYNTYQNNYGYETGTDSFNVNPSGTYLYTNICEDFPSLDNDRGLIYEQIQTVLLFALLSFGVLRWIFINK